MNRSKTKQKVVRKDKPPAKKTKEAKSVAIDEKQLNLLALENAESYVKIELEKLGRVEISVKAGKDANDKLMKEKEQLALASFKRIYEDPVISQHVQVFTPKQPKEPVSRQGKVQEQKEEEVESFI